MSSVLITSTMKSDPGMPLTRASSRGVPVSASAALPEGGSAEGALGACATTSAERTGAIAVAAPAATTPVRNLRRSAFGPGSLRDMVSSSCSASPGGDSNPGLLCLRFHGAQSPPRLGDQRARAARAPLHRPFGAGGQLLHRADRGPSPWIRQHPDAAADRASDPARHRAHARPLHLRDQRASLLVRRVLRQGILGRGFLVGVLRRDRLRAHLLGGERPRVRPAAHRRGAARGAPLAESAGLRAQTRGEVCNMSALRLQFLLPFPGLGHNPAPVQGGQNLDTTRNSENPSSFYDPAVALDFFQFAGKPQKIAKGTTLFSENRKGMPLLLMPNRIYLLLEGEVGIHANGAPVAVIQSAETFGEMASLGRTPRSASAVAMSDCRVIGLDDPQFQHELGRNPGFALMLMSIMASRLRDTIGGLGAPASDAKWRKAAALDTQLLADLAQGLGPAARFHYPAGRIVMTEGGRGAARVAGPKGPVPVRIGDSLAAKVVR